MGQPADGNQIDSRRGNLRSHIERDPAGCLGDRATANHSHGLAQFLDRHVVEQDSVGGEPQRLLKLGQRVDFDFDLDQMAGTGPRPLDGGADSAGPRSAYSPKEDMVTSRATGSFAPARDHVGCGAMFW